MKKEYASVFLSKTYGLVNTFFFTSDDTAFTKQADANAHAANLLKKKNGTNAVTAVTRAQYNEWLAAQSAPAVVLTPLEQAEKNVADATAALEKATTNQNMATGGLEKANANVAGLKSNATTSDKASAKRWITVATKALNAANEVVSNAKLDLTQAQSDLEALKNPA